MCSGAWIGTSSRKFVMNDDDVTFEITGVIGDAPFVMIS